MSRPSPWKTEKKVVKEKTKKERPERLAGWSVTLEEDDGGLEAWAKRKAAAAAPNGPAPKKKIVGQWEPFLCQVKYRCPKIHDVHTFNYESFGEEIKAKNQKTLQYVAPEKDNDKPGEPSDGNDKEKEEKGEEIEQPKNDNDSEKRTTEPKAGVERSRAKTAPGRRDSQASVSSRGSRCKTAEVPCTCGSGSPDSTGVTNTQHAKRLIAISAENHRKAAVSPNTLTSTDDRLVDSQKQVSEEQTSSDDAAQPESSTDIAQPVKGNSETIQASRRRPGFIKSVETLSRLLQNNPVRLSYTQSNITLGAQTQGNPGSGEAGSVASNDDSNGSVHTDTSVMANFGHFSPRHSVTMADDTVFITKVNKTSSMNGHRNNFNLRGSNGYKSFGHFERSHTVTDTPSVNSKNMTTRETDPVDVAKQSSQKSVAMVLKRVSIQDSNDNQNSQNNLFADSSIRLPVSSLQFPETPPQTVPRSNGNSATRKQVSPAMNSVHDENGQGRTSYGSPYYQQNATFEGIFPIGDLLPAADRNIRTGYFSKSLVKNPSDIVWSDRDQLLPSDNGVILLRDGVELLRLKDGTQAYLGPPAFRPQRSRTPLQRARDNTKKRLDGHHGSPHAQSDIIDMHRTYWPSANGSLYGPPKNRGSRDTTSRGGTYATPLSSSRTETPNLHSQNYTSPSQSARSSHSLPTPVRSIYKLSRRHREGAHVASRSSNSAKIKSGVTSMYMAADSRRMETLHDFRESEKSAAGT